MVLLIAQLNYTVQHVPYNYYVNKNETNNIFKCVLISEYKFNVMLRILWFFIITNFSMVKNKALKKIVN